MPTADEVRRVAAEMRAQGVRPQGGAPSAEEVRRVARAQAESAQGAPPPAGSPTPTPPQTEPSELDPYAEPPRVPVLEAVGSSLARVGASIVEPPVRTYAGLRRTLRKALPEAVQEWDAPAQARVNALEGAIRSTAEQANPVAQTVGGVVGETATLGAPMAAAGRAAVRALPRAAQRGRRLVRTVGEATGAALTEAARAPEGERWEQARNAFLATFGGAAAAKGAERVLKGVRKTPEAEALMDEGIRLSPGQAAARPFPRFAEKIMGDIPGISGPVRKMQVRGAKDWNRQLLNDVLPDIAAAQNMRVTESGYKGFQQVQQHFKTLYDGLFKEASDRVVQNPILMDNLMNGIRRSMVVAPRSLGKKKGRRFTEWLQAEAEKVHLGTPQRLQEFNTAIRDRMSQLRIKPKRGSRAEIDLLERLSQDFEKVVGGRASDLRKIERGYSGLSTLQKAATYKKALKEKFFTPDDLISAMKQKSSQRMSAAGRGRLQQAADVGLETVGELPAGPDRFIRGATTLGILFGGYVNPALMGGTVAAGRYGLVSEPMRRILLGQMEMTPEVADLLLRYGSRAGAGTAAAQREE